MRRSWEVVAERSGSFAGGTDAFIAWLTAEWAARDADAKGPVSTRAGDGTIVIMTLILVAPGGGRANVIAAGMAAAAGKRGARVNLGALQSAEVDVSEFVAAVGKLLGEVELVIVYLDEAAKDDQFIYGLCAAAEDADIDLVLHIACGRSTDDAVELVDALRARSLEPSGLILDTAPTDEQKYREARAFLGAAVGVPVVGALPEGAEALEPNEFARQSVRWFDDDDAFDD